MRKLTTFACLGFLVLNVMGYYGVFIGMQYRNDVQMTGMLNGNHYNESNSLKLKIPISVPYMADQPDYERVDGKFEYQGNVFRLVKQMYRQDTLIIVYVPDTKSDEINQALEAYVKTFSDKPVTTKQEGKTSITLIKEYVQSSKLLFAGSTGWRSDLTSDFRVVLFNNPHLSISTPPPRILS